MLERLIQPLPIRIFHWLMVVEVTILVLTGLLFYTNTDKLQLPFRVVRLLHGTASVAKLQAIFTGYVKESEEPSLPFTAKAAGTTVSGNFGEVNNEKP